MPLVYLLIVLIPLLSPHLYDISIANIFRDFFVTSIYVIYDFLLNIKMKKTVYSLTYNT